MKPKKKTELVELISNAQSAVLKLVDALQALEGELFLLGVEAYGAEAKKKKARARKGGGRGKTT